jgi:hypothetical protein
MYCKNSTEALKGAIDHPKSIIEMDLLLKIEGCPEIQNCFADKKGILVVNGDQLEKEICAISKSNLSSSMDIIYCINANNKSRVQFVELKLNSKRGLYNIDKSSFERKYNGSKSRLSHNDVITDKCFIVFRDSRIQEGIHLLKRTYPSIDRKFEIKKISEIADLHFSAHL